MAEPDSPQDSMFYDAKDWHFPQGLNLDGDVSVNGSLLDSFDPLNTGFLIPGNRKTAFGANAVGTTQSGRLNLHYFTAPKNFDPTNMHTYCGSVAAAATPTLCRMGYYRIATNGDGTLIGSTDNDTGLWAAISTDYSRPLTAHTPFVKGQRYAATYLLVTAGATPNLVTPIYVGLGFVDTVFALDPKITGRIESQADLPASFTAAQVLSCRNPFTTRYS